MWAGCKIALSLAGLLILTAQQVFAQNASNKPAVNFSTDSLSAIGLPVPNLTPIETTVSTTGLPVKVIHEGPALTGNFQLVITVSKRTTSQTSTPLRAISETTFHLEHLDAETDAIMTLPKDLNGLQVKAVIRDENQNLLLETRHPIPIVSNKLRLLKLARPSPTDIEPNPVPTLTGVELIRGKITFSDTSPLPVGSVLHVQLLENALAGGLSMQLAAQDTRPAILENGAVPFTLERSLWDRRDHIDLAFKAWVTDVMGRKIYVMSKAVSYNGPEIIYSLRLDGLRQGRDTKRGRTLNPGLMAQTLVQGDVEFDPVKGIPGQARLQVKLRQDRGHYNVNPILAEQTLILRGMETRIAFALTTDSTHFDPYAPAPFLSVDLVDSVGRIYYTSGEIRAREGRNSIRLFPR